MTFIESARPKTSLLDATTNLLDFAIVTYAVDPEKLRSVLPKSLTPDVFKLDDGRDVAFVSAVPFQDHGFHFHFAPFVKVAMGQTNYRAYVKRPDGKRVVYFFGTTLSGFWVRIPRDLWKLPWKTAKMKFDTEWKDDSLIRYTHSAESDWGPAELQLEGSLDSVEHLDGFQNKDEWAMVLTHPLIGYYFRSDQRIGSYSVWHKRLTLQKAEVKHASFPVFERLDLIDAQTPVHSALVMPRTEFVIYLPPRLSPELEC